MMNLVPLREACDLRIQSLNVKTLPDEFAYIDISSVDNQSKRITAISRVLRETASPRARQLVKTRDVLVSTVRPNLNAVAMVPPELDGQIGSTGFCVMRAGANLDPDYLFFWVRSEAFVSALTDLTKGALYPAVTDKQVLAQLIPLPPLAEQQRIAALLKAQLAEVEAAKAAATIQHEVAGQLEEAMIRESLESGQTTTISLAEVTREIKQGVGEAWADYPVLGATRDGLALAKEPVGKSPQRYKPVLPGTVFYNPMRINIGSIALVDEDDTPGITSPDYVALTGIEGKLHFRWFYHWLRSSYGAAFIKSLARGAVRERMLYNRLAEGEITLPDWNTQLATANRLAALRPLKARIAEQLETIRSMPQKLLSEIFGGLQSDMGEPLHD